MLILLQTLKILMTHALNDIGALFTRENTFKFKFVLKTIKNFMTHVLSEQSFFPFVNRAEYVA